MDLNKNAPDPFLFLFKNREAVIKAIRDKSTLPKAWDTLSEKLPEIKRITKFNTFKGYARILNVVYDEFTKIESGHRNYQAPEVLPVQNAPKQIKGWGVQLKGKYYRLFKKINGKVKWIHVGRTWDSELAESKINKFYNA